MSNARIFFAGVGTTILLIGAGFGGGLMMAKTAIEPVQNNRTAADRLPPARVILPASAEAAPVPPAPLREASVSPPATAPVQQPQPQPQVVPVNDAQPIVEKDKEAERAERRKVEAADRERRKRYAERKAKRDAARAQQTLLAQDARRQERAGIMAFGGDDEGARPGGFFGN